jgi:hypothetical protein
MDVPTFDELLAVVCAVASFRDTARMLLDVRNIMRAHGVGADDIKGVTVRFFLASPHNQRAMWSHMLDSHADDEWTTVHITAALVSAHTQAMQEIQEMAAVQGVSCVPCVP